MVNSKQKGSSFEREVCKKLSLWISEGEREDLFWRSAMSGGRATVGAKKGKDLRHQAGDICAVHPEGHKLTDVFYLECKHVKKLALDQFLVKGTGPLATFWHICQREAAKHERKPVIIARQNGWPTLWISAHRFAEIPFIIAIDVDIYLFDSVVGGHVHLSDR